MSETTPPTPPTSGRVRRRASRQAGPVGDQGRPAAEVTVVPTGSTANSDAARTPPTDTATSSAAVPVHAHEADAAAAGKSAGAVGDAGATSTIATGSSAKATAAEGISDAELRGPEAGGAGGSADIDAGATSDQPAAGTAKIVAAETDSTVKRDSAGNPAASGAEPVDAPVDEPVDAPGTQGEVVSGKRRFRSSIRPIEWAAAAVAVLALLGLLGSGGAYAYHRSHADALASQRAEYIQTAKQAILNLTNIKDDTASQDIDRVLSVASGDLKAEYSQRKDAYAQVVKEAKVKASGEVIEAAIESQNDDSAQVLVAAKQTLTNAGDSQPQDRYYRFRVTVNRGDGGVTASKVEFVA